MSVSALLDTYLFDADTMLTRMSQTAVFGLLFLLLRRHLPQEVAALPRRLWNLILALAMMPLCALPRWCSCPTGNGSLWPPTLWP